MKNLNDLAITTFETLLQLPDEEFYRIFDNQKATDLTELLLDSGMFSYAKEQADQYSEFIPKESPNIKIWDEWFKKTPSYYAVNFTPFNVATSVVNSSFHITMKSGAPIPNVFENIKLEGAIFSTAFKSTGSYSVSSEGGPSISITIEGDCQNNLVANGFPSYNNDYDLAA